MLMVRGSFFLLSPFCFFFYLFQLSFPMELDVDADYYFLCLKDAMRLFSIL